MKVISLSLLFISCVFSNFCSDNSYKTSITSTVGLSDVLSFGSLVNLIHEHDSSDQSSIREQSSIYFDALVENNLARSVLGTIICHKSTSHPEFAETVLTELVPKSDAHYQLLVRAVGNGYKNRFKQSNKLADLDKALQLYELAYGLEEDFRCLINISEIRFLQNDLQAAVFYLAKARKITSLSYRANEELESLYARINEDARSGGLKSRFQKTIYAIMRFERQGLYAVDL